MQARPSLVWVVTPDGKKMLVPASWMLSEKKYEKKVRDLARREKAAQKFFAKQKPFSHNFNG